MTDVQFLCRQHDFRQNPGRIIAFFRRTGVRGLSGQTDAQPLGGGLGQPFPVDQAALRIAAQIVEGVDLRDSLFCDQVPADQGARADLLPRLEDQIHVPGGLHLIQCQRQPAQGGAVAVVPALVRDALIL